MGIARTDMAKLRASAQRAAEMQTTLFADLRLDVSKLEFRSLHGIPIAPSDEAKDCVVGVVAADAGLVSIELAPFALEFLFVADSLGKVHIAEIFPLTTLASDLEAIFESIAVLQEFPRRLGVAWRDLSDLWQKSLDADRPFPRDVRVVSDTLREVAEWAVAMSLAVPVEPAEPTPSIGERRQRFTRLVLHDGMLRSILLRSDLVCEALPHWWQTVGWGQHGVVLAGIGKSSAVWEKLGLALDLDRRVPRKGAFFVPIPEDFEATLSGRRSSGTRLGFGRLFLLRTGGGSHGNYLPVDLPPWIADDLDLAGEVLAHVADQCRTTFPQIGYPTPLGKAHELAHLTEFDAKVIRDLLLNEFRDLIPAPEFEILLRGWTFGRRKWEKVGRLGKD